MSFQPHLNALLISANRDRLHDDDHVASLGGVWHRVGDLRAAAANDATFRTNTSKENSYDPPDPYAAGLAKLRAQLPDTSWPTPPPVAPVPSGDYSAPDPYKDAIAKLKENRR